MHFGLDTCNYSVLTCHSLNEHDEFVTVVKGKRKGCEIEDGVGKMSVWVLCKTYWLPSFLFSEVRVCHIFWWVQSPNLTPFPPSILSASISKHCRSSVYVALFLSAVLPTASHDRITTGTAFPPFFICQPAPRLDTAHTSSSTASPSYSHPSPQCRCHKAIHLWPSSLSAPFSI